MKEYAVIYHLYNSQIFRVIRAAILLILIFVFAFQNRDILGIISAFLLWEVFFRVKISKAKPTKTVDKNDEKNIYDSFTLSAYELSLIKSPKDLVRTLLNDPSIKFILDKTDVGKTDEIKFADIATSEIMRGAFGLVKSLSGKYVTPADIFASYILLSEDKTKFLFQKDLKKEEFTQILVWARTRFAEREDPSPLRAQFWGEGIGEDWVYGWTTETKKYMLDLTPEVLSKKPEIFGRGEELRQLIEAMYKNKSALLVGEPGSGRKEIAKYLAFQSFLGSLKGSLFHQRFYELLVDSLLSGTDNIGDLEARVTSIIAEISHSGNIIIFLPSFENILGSSSFHLDLSGVLQPYIERGNVRIIGTITDGAYKKFVEGRKTFANNLEVIKVNEPDEKTALSMLFKRSDELETEKTKISYKAVVAALKYSKKYLPDRVLPGSAITLLKDAAASANISGKLILEEKDIEEKVQQKTNIAIGKPKGEEKKILLNLEDEIHKRVVDQNEAVSGVSEALRRVRTGLAPEDRPISFLFLGPTGVGKTETAKALSRIYFGGEEKMIRLDMSEYSDDNSLKRLLGSLPGEGAAPGELTDKIFENPFSLVLLDEFEKANPQILNLFLQVLEDGRLTDNRGRTVSFSNAIIIATSNAGSEFIREEVEKGSKVDKKFQQSLVDLLQKQNIFKPELLNRFDAVVVFKPLGEGEIKEVAKHLLFEFADKMQDQEVTISFDESLLAKVVSEGFDREFGARPIRRYIQDNIEDPIAKKILKEEVKRGEKVSISVDPKGNIQIVS